MKLEVLEASKDMFGLWTVEIKINSSKAYTYHLADYGYTKFLKQYRAGRMERAVEALNKYNEEAT